jgi:hypothetical protein
LSMRRATIAVVLVLIVSACGNSMPTMMPTGMPNQISKQTPGGDTPVGYQVVMIQSVITVGSGRFAIGLLSGDTFVKDAKLTLTFYDLTQNMQKEAGTYPAMYREGPDGLVGIYTTEVNFPTAGSWGVAIKGTTADGKPIEQSIGFDVAAKSTEVAIGQKPPAAKSPTLDSVGGDLKRLTSSTNPNQNFYRLSLDQAISNGKPSIVQFSTPSFCSSRLCGPAYDVMNAVFPAYVNKLNFVHIEVYKDLPNPNLSKPQYADAMLAWGLNSEPWTYLLDKNGVVVWRVEGLVTSDELKAVIDNLLKAG